MIVALAGPQLIRNAGEAISVELFSSRKFLMPAGTLKFFDVQRGFGFVAPYDGGEDLFVHISAVEKSGLPRLNKNDFIEFDVERDGRTGKFIVTNIDLITAGPSQ